MNFRWEPEQGTSEKSPDGTDGNPLVLRVAAAISGRKSATSCGKLNDAEINVEQLANQVRTALNSNEEDSVFSALASLDHNPTLIGKIKEFYMLNFGVDIEIDIQDQLWNWMGVWQDESKALAYLGQTTAGEKEKQVAEHRDEGKNLDAREKVLLRAQEYVAQKPDYGYGGDGARPEPGNGKIDCSAMVASCIISAGYTDPYDNPSTGTRNTGIAKEDGSGKWGNGVALMVSNPGWQEKGLNEMERGDVATFWTSRDNQKGENGQFDHVGFIEAVKKDESGKLVSFDFLHSFGNKKKKSSGPQRTSYSMEKPPSYIKLMGVFNWDYDQNSFTQNE